jgi:hypothetical protein
VIGLGIGQALELATRLAVAAPALVVQGQQQALVDVGVAQEHPALRTELVRLVRIVSASVASHGCFSWVACHRFGDGVLRRF